MAQTESHFPGNPLERRTVASKNSKLRQRAVTDNTSTGVPTADVHARMHERLCGHTEKKHMPRGLLFLREDTAATSKTKGHPCHERVHGAHVLKI